jgi:hypothetical protein
MPVPRTPTPEDRLLVALAPGPENRDRVKTMIVRLAADLADVDLLDQVATAAEGQRTVTTTQLAERAGVTYRQVDYWTRHGYLTPLPGHTGQGYPRAYPVDQIVKARIMGSLAKLFAYNHDGAARIAEEIMTSGSAQVGGYTLRRGAFR